MAVADVTTLIQALTPKLGQDVNLKANVTVNLSSVRRAGDGDTLVLFGTITKDGVVYVPAGGWPVVWVSPGPNFTSRTAIAAAQQMLADLVP